MLHIFCIRISSQLREICDKEKQQFWPDSLPLSGIAKINSAAAFWTIGTFKFAVYRRPSAKLYITEIKIPWAFPVHALINQNFLGMKS